MYKTDFIVKYNTIENELLQLLEKEEPLKEEEEEAEKQQILNRRRPPPLRDSAMQFVLISSFNQHSVCKHRHDLSHLVCAKQPHIRL